MARRRQTGMVRTMAVAVTSIVPTMKGKKPNSPRRGAQEDEKRRWRIDSLTRIGLDLMNKPRAIRNAMEFTKAMARSMDFAARPSFTLLHFIRYLFPLQPDRNVARKPRPLGRVKGHNIKETTFPGSPALEGVELHCFR